MSMALVVLTILALILPTISYAFSPRPVGFGDGSVGSGYIARGNTVTVVGQNTVTTISPTNGGYTVTTTVYNAHAQPVSQTVINVGPASKYTFTTYNTQTTITKTYTQTIYYTTVINSVITKYLMPIIQWELTYINIGQYQAQGYHTIGNTKTFLPGSYGGGEIFVPVYSQEAIYAFNIVPSTKPQVVGWYVGSQSQSTSTSTSISKTPPQLASIQQTVDTIQQLATITIPNVTRANTYWNYITQPGQNNTIIWTPPPYYYSKQDIQGAYSTAWSDFVHGNILGAVYETGRGLYMQTWNTLAGAVYSAYRFMLVAGNAFNTATLAKSIGLGFGTITSYVSSLLTHW